jgi:hypothetical protein
MCGSLLTRIPKYAANKSTFIVSRIVFFLAVALTSSALIIERMEGLLDRSWVAGNRFLCKTFCIELHKLN